MPGQERKGRPAAALAAFLRRPVGAAVLALAVMAFQVLAMMKFHAPYFQTNDDSAMADIVYGTNGQPDPHLVYSNILLGRLLVALLSLFPQVAWYAVGEMATVALSFAAVLFLLFRRFGGKNAWLPASLLVFFFGVQFITRLQFSCVAGIACLAGMLLLFYGAEEKGRTLALIFGGGLTVLGSLYRFEVLVMLLVPLAGVGVHVLWPLLRKRDWRKAGRLAAIFACVLGVCVALRLYDGAVYRADPDWRVYKTFNRLRSQMLDMGGFPAYGENEALYDSLHISPDDLAMFEDWNFDDPEIFSTQALEKLAAVKARPALNGDMLRLFRSAILPRILEYPFLACLAAAAALCFLCMESGALGLILYALIAPAAIAFCLLGIGRLDGVSLFSLPYVDTCGVLASSVILLLYGLSPRWTLRRPAALLLAAATLLGNVVLVQDYGRDGTQIQAVQEEIAAEDMHEDGEHLYLCSTMRGITYGDVWKRRPVGWCGNSTSLGGWKTRTPLRQVILDRFGVTNSFRDMVDDPRVYLVTSAEWRTDMLLAYIRRHYAPQAEAYCVRKLPNACGVYRVLTAPPLPDTTHAVPGDDRLVFGFGAWEETDAGLYLTGQLYVKGVSGNETARYVAIAHANGETEYLLLPQVRADDGVERPEGWYICFNVTLSTWRRGDKLTFYVETPQQTYRIAADASMAPKA